MIRINLLPEEYRNAGRTPVKLLLSVAAAVSINGLLVAWWAWLAFGIAAEIESERTVLQTEMDGLTPQVKYHQALEGEQKRFASRERTLADITASRISWTQKIDQLLDVISSGSSTSRHFVWLDDLTVSQKVNARTKSGGSLRAAGFSGSDNFAQVANYLEDIENSESFMKHFRKPGPPEGTESVVDEELIPAVVWSFPLSLEINTPEERQ